MDRNIIVGRNGKLILVALRKESVDRNINVESLRSKIHASLSARRAWIEIKREYKKRIKAPSRSPQGERG